MGDISWINKRLNISNNPETIKLTKDEINTIQSGLLTANFKSEYQDKFIAVFFPGIGNETKICAVIWRTSTDWVYSVVDERWWRCLIAREKGVVQRNLLIKTIDELPIFDNDQNPTTTTTLG